MTSFILVKKKKIIDTNWFCREEDKEEFYFDYKLIV